MGASDTIKASQFYLYVGRSGLLPSTVFFEVEDESIARDLCKLFADEYGTVGSIVVNYQGLPADALSDEVRLGESLADLHLYDDYDPGIYDPPPSSQTLTRADYARRAQVWENLLRQRRTRTQNGAESADPQEDRTPAAVGKQLAPKAAQTNGSTEFDTPTKTAFPTPEGAKWSDISIKVVDGETVSIKSAEYSCRYIYSELKMIDGRTKKPTKQWELLRLFADNQGILTWKSAGADRKNQKRKEILAKNLKAFFGIKGSPIVMTEDKKGWRTEFSISSGN